MCLSDPFEEKPVNPCTTIGLDDLPRTFVIVDDKARIIGLDPTTGDIGIQYPDGTLVIDHVNTHHLGTHWQIGYGGFRYHLQPYPWMRRANVQIT